MNPCQGIAPLDQLRPFLLEMFVTLRILIVYIQFRISEPPCGGKSKIMSSFYPNHKVPNFVHNIIILRSRSKQILNNVLLPLINHSHRHTGHGAGGGGASRIFSTSHFQARNLVIFGQNHLIFVQAMEKKIFGQETSTPPPPPNETRPVRL